MRHLLLFFISISFTSIITAQSERASLDTSLFHYFDASERLDVEAILNYMHPKLFEMAPREIIAESMEQAFNSPEVKVRLKDGKVLKTSDLQKEDNVEYALIDYSFIMEMQMLKETEEADEDQTAEKDTSEIEMPDMTEMMLNMFKMQYGADNVKYDAEKSTVEIFTEKKMFGINDPELDTWKFIEKKDDGQGLIDMIIPKSVQKKLVK